jgi:Protein of unknown function (DUF4019)
MNSRFIVPAAVLLVACVCARAGEIAATLPNSTKQVKIPTIALDPRALAVALGESNRFLSALSSGDFGRCYDMLEVTAKKQISKEQWGKKLGAMLSPLGAREHSEFLSAFETESLPHGSPGKYISILLLTSFTHGHIDETISLVDKNGKWQVVGYHLQVATQGAT